jgi:mannose/fructose-specific phosphotransferase system component IIA
MSESVRGVIVSHGHLGRALVDTVESITGMTGVLTAVTNEGCDRAKLLERVATATGAQPCVVFVDLEGGSCFRAAARLAHEQSGVRVIVGVNLPMLLEFVFHRDDGLQEVTERATKAGARGIRLATG